MLDLSFQTALLNKSDKAKLLLLPLIRALEQCQSVEEVEKLNEEIASFCSHVRNSIDLKKTSQSNTL